MLFATFGVGQVLLSMIYFFLILMWIMLLFHIFGDVFRSTDLSGVMKVLWLLFVMVTPYLGVFVYLIVRGPKMAERQVAGMQASDAAAREYIRSAAGTGSAADELARLADLRDKGIIDDAELARLKAKIIA